MTNKEEKIKLTESGVITQEALLAYLNDQLSPGDRMEIDRLLKDDPFAQEALEGLKSAQSKTAITDSLQSIRQKVHHRIDKKESRLLRIHWTNYAWAAVILGLLISLGSIMIVYFGNKADNNRPAEQSQVTEQKKEEPPLTQTPVIPADTAAQTAVVANSPASAPVISNPVAIKQLTDSSMLKAGARDLTKVRKDTAGDAMLAKNEVFAAKKARVAAAKANNDLAANNSEAEANTRGMAPAAARVSGNNLVTADKSKTAASAEESISSPEKVTLEEAKKTFNSGDYKKSARQFDELLKKEPDNAEVIFFDGVSNYVTGDLKKSEKNFDELLTKRKKFRDGAKWYKANILYKQGDKEQAKKMFQELSETGGSYKERAQKKLAETQF